MAQKLQIIARTSRTTTIGVKIPLRPARGPIGSEEVAIARGFSDVIDAADRNTFPAVFLLREGFLLMVINGPRKERLDDPTTSALARSE